MRKTIIYLFSRVAYLTHYMSPISTLPHSLYATHLTHYVTTHLTPLSHTLYVTPCLTHLTPYLTHYVTTHLTPYMSPPISPYFRITP